MKIKEPENKDLKNFAFGTAILFLGLSALFYYKEKLDYIYVYLSIGGIAGLIGLVKPIIIKPVYTLWMKFAIALGQINTRIILFLVFALTIIPIGLIMKLFRKDLLDQKIDKSKSSYWIPRDEKEIDTKSYERHF